MKVNYFSELFEDCQSDKSVTQSAPVSKSLKSDVCINDILDFPLQRVCKIKNPYVSSNSHRRYKIEWIYEDIDEEIMYSEHRSWVYCITVNGCIVKIGETGNPLGIKKTGRYSLCNQPKYGSTNRLGRYNHYDQKGDGDQAIREYLYKHIQAGDLVEFYAYKCPVINTDIVIGGQTLSVKSTIHRDLEKQFLDYYVSVVGYLPLLNMGRY